MARDPECNWKMVLFFCVRAQHPVQPDSTWWPWCRYRPREQKHPEKVLKSLKVIENSLHSTANMSVWMERSKPVCQSWPSHCAFKTCKLQSKAPLHPRTRLKIWVTISHNAAEADGCSHASGQHYCGGTQAPEQTVWLSHRRAPQTSAHPVNVQAEQVWELSCQHSDKSFWIDIAAAISDSGGWLGFYHLIT